VPCRGDRRGERRPRCGRRLPRRTRGRRGHARDRRGGVDVADRDRRQVGPFPQPGAEPGHHHRVRTQVVEHVAVGRHVLDAQHLGQDLREPLHDVVAARGRRHGRRRRGRLGEPGDRRVRVHVLDRDRRQVGPLAQPRAEPGHHHRVGAQVVEHVAVGRDVLHRQDLGQHARQRRGQARTRRRPGVRRGPRDRRLAHAGTDGRSGCRRRSRWSRLLRRPDVPGAPARPLADLGRRRKARPVDVSVGSDRHGVEPHEYRGDVVPGQLLTEPGPEHLLVDRGTVGAAGVVADQPDVVGGEVLHRGDRGGHPGHRHHHGLDRGEIDPLPPEIHLQCDPAAVLDPPGVVDPSEVAGPVDPAGRIAGDAEEVLDDRRAIRVPVPAREPEPGEAHLTGLAMPEGQGEVGIEHDGREGRQRHTDHRRGVRVGLGPGGRHRRTLRHVGGEDAPPGPVPPRDQARRARLAGDHQQPHRGKVRLDRREQGRCGAPRGHPAVGELGVQRSSVEGRFGGHQGRAGGPRHPRLLDAAAREERASLVDPVPPDPERLRGDPHRVAETAVVDHLRLRPSRGAAGGVEDVGGPVGALTTLGRLEPRGAHLRDQLRGVVDRDDPGPQGVGGRDPPLQVPAAEHDTRRGVGEDERRAVRRGVGIERHARPAEREDGELGDVGVDAVVEQQRDPVAGADTAQAQVAGEPVGPGGELVVGQRDPGPVDGELARAPVLPDPVAPLLEDGVEALMAADPPALRLVPVDDHELGQRDVRPQADGGARALGTGVPRRDDRHEAPTPATSLLRHTKEIAFDVFVSIARECPWTEGPDNGTKYPASRAQEGQFRGSNRSLGE
jgi:hypothetical protein